MGADGAMIMMRYTRPLWARAGRRHRAAPAKSAIASRRLVCRERSIVRGDGGRFTARADLALKRSEARAGVLRHPWRPHLSFRFLPLPALLKGGSGLRTGRGAWTRLPDGTPYVGR